MSFIWGPIQMLLACLMFILTVQHDRDTLSRVAVVVLIHIPFYVLLPLDAWAENIALWQYVFAFYLCVSLLYVHFIMKCSFWQAIYCTTCALSVQHIFCNIKLATRQLLGQQFWAELFIMVLVYAFFYAVFASGLFAGVFNRPEKIDLLSSVVVVLLVFGINASGKGERPAGMFFMWRLADTICCCYILWLQAVKQERYRLQREKEELQQIVEQQKHQYEITSSMIERINELCHDIKHQLHSAGTSLDGEPLKEYLGKIADHIAVYDTAIRTGNKALDTVLMEKGLRCKEKQIQWLCMADGSKMSFISPCDIYAVFGNLIDNAIEAAEKLADTEKRIINVRATTHESLMMIEVENLYDGDVVFDGGLPVTTKENRGTHGYGMRSVEYIVGTYGGTFNVQAKNGVFRAKILIPIPCEAADASAQ